MVKYNKIIQKYIDISIMNYKYITGKYIVFGENRTGKEYDFMDNLLFEGEYSNGEKNGKGKEYYKWNKKILFEGEYLKRKRNGKGKEYSDTGNLKFESEYLNGERNGKWKEYYDKDNLEFEGEYLNGKRNGFGKLYSYGNKLIYEGEYLNGKMNGKGKQYYDDGNLKCEGEFFNDLFLFGKIYGQNGNLMKHLDKNNGRIIRFFQPNNRFDCDYLNGKI